MEALVVTADERENQLLLNCCTKWCQWSMMKIRVDKCVAFGLKMFSTRSMQFQPKLFIKKEIVPSVKSGESFRYLGRYFNFEMDDKDHKVQIQSCLLNMLQRIDSFTILPSNKLLLYHRWVLSKLSWPLTVTNLSKTWIVEDLNSVTTRLVRKWLKLTISATLSEIILPPSKFGLNFQLPSTKFVQCQNVLHSVLTSSSIDTINSLWKSTSCGTNIQYDIYQNTKQVLKVVQQEHTDKLSNQLISQGFIISFLLNHSLKALNSLWSSTQSKLPNNIFNFTIRYLNNTLATRNNLQKWNLSQSSDCSFFLKSETLLHVVAGCKTYLKEGRYT